MTGPAAAPSMTPAPAASLLLMRPAPTGGFEILMGRRPAEGAFADVWVFPGGRVEPIDHDPGLTGGSGLADAAWRFAALRETAEEVGVHLTIPAFRPDSATGGADLYRALRSSHARFDVEGIQYLSNWVTPQGAPRRFDTRFFTAIAPPDLGPVRAVSEFVDVGWINPGEALAEFEAGIRPMILPTLKHLELLNRFDGPGDVMDHAAALDPVTAVEPRMLIREGAVRFLIPGDEGFEEAGR